MKIQFTSVVAAFLVVHWWNGPGVTTVSAQEEDSTTMDMTMDSAVAVGDTYCVEGYVMDYLCIERGTLLDRPSVQTLEGPGEHSVHCLVDVSSCLNTPFEVLSEPTEGSSMYGRGWRVTEETKPVLVDLARQVGTCSTCTGEGSQVRGFRAAMVATVVASANGDTPPLIEVTTAVSSETDPFASCQQNFPDLIAASSLNLMNAVTDGGEEDTNGTTDNGDGDAPTDAPSGSMEPGRFIAAGFSTFTLQMLLLLL